MIAVLAGAAVLGVAVAVIVDAFVRKQQRVRDDVAALLWRERTATW